MADEGERKKTRIPKLRFRQAVRKVQKEKQDTPIEIETQARPRRSSIPRLIAKPKPEEEHKSKEEDEFDKIYDEIVQSPVDLDSNVLNTSIEDPVKVDDKFEEIIHAYEDKLPAKQSKIPTRHKTDSDVDTANAPAKGESKSKLSAFRSKVKNAISKQSKPTEVPKPKPRNVLSTDAKTVVNKGENVTLKPKTEDTLAVDVNESFLVNANTEEQDYISEVDKNKNNEIMTRNINETSISQENVPLEETDETVFTNIPCDDTTKKTEYTAVVYNYLEQLVLYPNQGEDKSAAIKTTSPNHEEQVTIHDESKENALDNETKIEEVRFVETDEIGEKSGIDLGINTEANVAEDSDELWLCIGEEASPHKLGSEYMILNTGDTDDKIESPPLVAEKEHDAIDIEDTTQELILTREIFEETLPIRVMDDITPALVIVGEEGVVFVDSPEKHNSIETIHHPITIIEYNEPLSISIEQSSISHESEENSSTGENSNNEDVNTVENVIFNEPLPQTPVLRYTEDRPSTTPISQARNEDVSILKEVIEYVPSVSSIEYEDFSLDKDISESENKTDEMTSNEQTILSDVIESAENISIDKVKVEPIQEFNMEIQKYMKHLVSSDSNNNNNTLEYISNDSDIATDEISVSHFDNNRERLYVSEDSINNTPITNDFNEIQDYATQTITNNIKESEITATVDNNETIDIYEPEDIIKLPHMATKDSEEIHVIAEPLIDQLEATEVETITLEAGESAAVSVELQMDVVHDTDIDTPVLKGKVERIVTRLNSRDENTTKKSEVVIPKTTSVLSKIAIFEIKNYCIPQHDSEEIQMKIQVSIERKIKDTPCEIAESAIYKDVEKKSINQTIDEERPTILNAKESTPTEVLILENATSIAVADVREVSNAAELASHPVEIKSENKDVVVNEIDAAIENKYNTIDEKVQEERVAITQVLDSDSKSEIIDDTVDSTVKLKTNIGVVEIVNNATSKEVTKAPKVDNVIEVSQNKQTVVEKDLEEQIAVIEDSDFQVIEPNAVSIVQETVNVVELEDNLCVVDVVDEIQSPAVFPETAVVVSKYQEQNIHVNDLEVRNSKIVETAAPIVINVVEQAVNATDLEPVQLIAEPVNLSDRQVTIDDSNVTVKEIQVEDINDPSIIEASETILEEPFDVSVTTEQATMNDQVEVQIATEVLILEDKASVVNIEVNQSTKLAESESRPIMIQPKTQIANQAEVQLPTEILISEETNSVDNAKINQSINTSHSENTSIDIETETQIINVKEINIITDYEDRTAVLTDPGEQIVIIQALDSESRASEIILQATDSTVQEPINLVDLEGNHCVVYVVDQAESVEVIQTPTVIQETATEVAEKDLSVIQKDLKEQVIVIQTLDTESKATELKVQAIDIIVEVPVNFVTPEETICVIETVNQAESVEVIQAPTAIKETATEIPENELTAGQREQVAIIESIAEECTNSEVIEPNAVNIVEETVNVVKRVDNLCVVDLFDETQTSLVTQETAAVISEYQKQKVLVNDVEIRESEILELKAPTAVNVVEQAVNAIDLEPNQLIAESVSISDHQETVQDTNVAVEQIKIRAITDPLTKDASKTIKEGSLSKSVTAEQASTDDQVVDHIPTEVLTMEDSDSIETTQVKQPRIPAESGSNPTYIQSEIQDVDTQEIDNVTKNKENTDLQKNPEQEDVSIETLGYESQASEIITHTTESTIEESINFVDVGENHCVVETKNQAQSIEIIEATMVIQETVTEAPAKEITAVQKNLGQPLEIVESVVEESTDSQVIEPITVNIVEEEENLYVVDVVTQKQTPSLTQETNAVIPEYQEQRVLLEDLDIRNSKIVETAAPIIANVEEQATNIKDIKSKQLIAESEKKSDHKGSVEDSTVTVDQINVVDTNDPYTREVPETIIEKSLDVSVTTEQATINDQFEVQIATEVFILEDTASVVNVEVNESTKLAESESTPILIQPKTQVIDNQAEVQVPTESLISEETNSVDNAKVNQSINLSHSENTPTDIETEKQIINVEEINIITDSKVRTAVLTDPGEQIVIIQASDSESRASEIILQATYSTVEEPINLVDLEGNHCVVDVVDQAESVEVIQTPTVIQETTTEVAEKDLSVIQKDLKEQVIVIQALDAEPKATELKVQTIDIMVEVPINFVNPEENICVINTVKQAESVEVIQAPTAIKETATEIPEDELTAGQRDLGEQVAIIEAIAEECTNSEVKESNVVNIVEETVNVIEQGNNLRFVDISDETQTSIVTQKTAAVVPKYQEQKLLVNDVKIRESEILELKAHTAVNVVEQAVNATDLEPDQLNAGSVSTSDHQETVQDSDVTIEQIKVRDITDLLTKDASITIIEESLDKSVTAEQASTDQVEDQIPTEVLIMEHSDSIETTQLNQPRIPTKSGSNPTYIQSKIQDVDTLEIAIVTKNKEHTAIQKDLEQGNVSTETLGDESKASEIIIHTTESTTEESINFVDPGENQSVEITEATIVIQETVTEAPAKELTAVQENLKQQLAIVESVVEESIDSQVIEPITVNIVEEEENLYVVDVVTQKQTPALTQETDAVVPEYQEQKVDIRNSKIVETAAPITVNIVEQSINATDLELDQLISDPKETDENSTVTIEHIKVADFNDPFKRETSEIIIEEPLGVSIAAEQTSEYEQVEVQVATEILKDYTSVASCEVNKKINIADSEKYPINIESEKQDTNVKEIKIIKENEAQTAVQKNIEEQLIIIQALDNESRASEIIVQATDIKVEDSVNFVGPEENVCVIDTVNQTESVEVIQAPTIIKEITTEVPENELTAIQKELKKQVATVESTLGECTDSQETGPATVNMVEETINFVDRENNFCDVDVVDEIQTPDITQETATMVPKYQEQRVLIDDVKIMDSKILEPAALIVANIVEQAVNNATDLESNQVIAESVSPKDRKEKDTDVTLITTIDLNDLAKRETSEFIIEEPLDVSEQDSINDQVEVQISTEVLIMEDTTIIANAKQNQLRNPAESEKYPIDVESEKQVVNVTEKDINIENKDHNAEKKDEEVTIIQALEVESRASEITVQAIDSTVEEPANLVNLEKNLGVVDTVDHAESIEVIQAPTIINETTTECPEKIQVAVELDLKDQKVIIQALDSQSRASEIILQATDSTVEEPINLVDLEGNHCVVDIVEKAESVEVIQAPTVIQDTTTEVTEKELSVVQKDLKEQVIVIQALDAESKASEFEIQAMDSKIEVPVNFVNPEENICVIDTVNQAEGTAEKEQTAVVMDLEDQIVIIQALESESRASEIILKATDSAVEAVIDEEEKHCVDDTVNQAKTVEIIETPMVIQDTATEAPAKELSAVTTVEEIINFIDNLHNIDIVDQIQTPIVIQETTIAVPEYEEHKLLVDDVEIKDSKILNIATPPTTTTELGPNQLMAELVHLIDLKNIVEDSSGAQEETTVADLNGPTTKEAYEKTIERDHILETRNEEQHVEIFAIDMIMEETAVHENFDETPSTVIVLDNNETGSHIRKETTKENVPISLIQEQNLGVIQVLDDESRTSEIKKQVAENAEAKSQNNVVDTIDFATCVEKIQTSEILKGTTSAGSDKEQTTVQKNLELVENSTDLQLKKSTALNRVEETVNFIERDNNLCALYVVKQTKIPAVIQEDPPAFSELVLDDDDVEIRDPITLEIVAPITANVIEKAVNTTNLDADEIIAKSVNISDREKTVIDSKMTEHINAVDVNYHTAVEPIHVTETITEKNVNIIEAELDSNILRTVNKDLVKVAAIENIQEETAVNDAHNDRLHTANNNSNEVPIEGNIQSTIPTDVEDKQPSFETNRMIYYQLSPKQLLNVDESVNNMETKEETRVIEGKITLKSIKPVPYEGHMQIQNLMKHLIPNYSQDQSIVISDSKLNNVEELNEKELEIATEIVNLEDQVIVLNREDVEGNETQDEDCDITILKGKVNKMIEILSSKANTIPTNVNNNGEELGEKELEISTKIVNPEDLSKEDVKDKEIQDEDYDTPILKGKVKKMIDVLSSKINEISTKVNNEEFDEKEFEIATEIVNLEDLSKEDVEDTEVLVGDYDIPILKGKVNKIIEILSAKANEIPSKVNNVEELDEKEFEISTEMVNLEDQNLRKEDVKDNDIQDEDDNIPILKGKVKKIIDMLSSKVKATYVNNEELNEKNIEIATEMVNLEDQDLSKEAVKGIEIQDEDYDIPILKGKVNKMVQILSSKANENSANKEHSEVIRPNLVLTKIALFEKIADETPKATPLIKVIDDPDDSKPKIVNGVLKPTADKSLLYGDTDKSYNELENVQLEEDTAEYIDYVDDSGHTATDYETFIPDESLIEDDYLEDKVEEIYYYVDKDVPSDLEEYAYRDMNHYYTEDNRNLDRQTSNIENRIRRLTSTVEENNLKKAKSLAELDLGDAVKGRVHEMKHWISSRENLTFEKTDVINPKEMPRRKSVSEKIALFEGKLSVASNYHAQVTSRSVPRKEAAAETFDEEVQRKIQELDSAKRKYERRHNMTYVLLADGHEMPVISIGTCLIDKQLTAKVVAAAIDLGYRGIDAAYIYGNEKEVGEGIRQKIEDGTVTREELFISSKLWSTFHRTDLAEEACRNSLRAMGLDYFDQYLIHNPMSFKEGGEPIPKIANVIQYSEHDYLDAWYGLERLVTKGLVRTIGVSNFNESQLQKIIDKARVKPVVNQVECHPYLSQARMDVFCSERNVSLSCYGVLGSRGTPANLKAYHEPIIDDPLVRVMAAGIGITPSQLLIRYQIQQGRAVIIKSTNATHLYDNLQSLDISLTDAQIDALNALNRNRRMYTFIGMGDTHKNYPFKGL